MLSIELKQRLGALIEKYRQQELDFLEMLGKIDRPPANQSKPKIRVKAISNRWPTNTASAARIAREQ